MSTQQTQFTQCTVGEASSQIKFTITKLLSNVDVVLGMDWLARWNPVIDWRRQVMHLYVNRHWIPGTWSVVRWNSASGNCKNIGCLSCLWRKGIALIGLLRNDQCCGIWKSQLYKRWRKCQQMNQSPRTSLQDQRAL